MTHTAKTKNFKTKSGYERAQAYIHIHIHKGPSKHPYNVKIRGKRHRVEHRKDPKRRKKRGGHRDSGWLRF